MYYFMLIFPAVMWGTLGIFVGNINVSSVQIALIRTVLASLTLFLIYLFKKEKIELKQIKNNKFKLLISGICLGFNWIALFEAYKLTSIGIATVVYYLAPAIVIAVSPFIFKENLKLNKVIGLISAIIGMVLVSFSAGMGDVSVLGVCLAFFGAVLYAILLMTNKAIKGITGFNVAMIEMAIAAVVLAFYSLVIIKETWIIPDTKSIVNLAIIGVFHTGICYGFYFSAVQKVNVQTSAICSFADPFSALIIATVVLKEIMTLPQFIGAILIIGGAMFAEIYRKKEKQCLMQ